MGRQQDYRDLGIRLPSAGHRSTQSVQRTPYPTAATVEHMRVHHRRADILVAQHSWIVRMLYPDSRRCVANEMPQRMAAGAFREAGPLHGCLDRTLDDAFVRVMPAPLPGLPVHVEPRGRKRPLPSEFPISIRILSVQRIGKDHPPIAARQIASVQHCAWRRYCLVQATESPSGPTCLRVSRPACAPLAALRTRKGRWSLDHRP